MRIQTNIESLNAYRNLNTTNRAMSRSMERLSSGFRINRASDDAAGLAISEKMRGQIQGLNQAARNAQDGISLIQTAEGALNETHAILQEMRELANQAANDTYTQEDRDAIQQDIDHLTTEITRIGETTEFNTENLLDGTFEGKLHIGANADQDMDIEIGDMTASELLGAGEGGEGTEGTAAQGTTDVGEDEVTITGGEHEDYNMTIAFETGEAAGDETAAYDGGTLTVALNETAEYDSGAIQGILRDAGGMPENTDADNFSVEGLDEDTAGSDWASAEDVQLTGGEAGEEGEAGVSGVDVTDRESANESLNTLDQAIEQVSTQRSQLGAIQNRLEHTITNLEVASENLTAAESRIRDVDMAAEMTEFTKAQVLTEAGTAMLAQANMAPQSVLQLLG